MRLRARTTNHEGRKEKKYREFDAGLQGKGIT